MFIAPGYKNIKKKCPQIIHQHDCKWYSVFTYSFIFIFLFSFQLEWGKRESY